MLDLKKHSVLEIYSLFFQNICQCKINIDLYLGVFYITFHIIYITLIIYNLIFTHNLIYTCILLVIIFMNMVVVFILRTCPIVLLEKKYINTTYLKSIFFSKTDEKKDEKKNKNKRKINYVLSKYLDYDLDEITLQGLVTAGLILSIKLLLMFIFY
jgi:hypothetical protein